MGRTEKATEVEKLLLKRIILRFELPHSIQSHNGPLFTSGTSQKTEQASDSMEATSILETSIFCLKLRSTGNLGARVRGGLTSSVRHWAGRVRSRLLLAPPHSHFSSFLGFFSKLSSKYLQIHSSHTPRVFTFLLHVKGRYFLHWILHFGLAH